jgi:hypothetical protein
MNWSLMYNGAFDYPADTRGYTWGGSWISSSAGGYGFIIGDGELNYCAERILETYYAYKLQKMITLRLDYQFAGNPAYNKDRGSMSSVCIGSSDTPLSVVNPNMGTLWARPVSPLPSRFS